jgi:hypothetical protein
MTFHAYVMHVVVARPAGTAWCTRDLHAVLGLCTAATLLEDLVQAGDVADPLTRAAIAVALESLEASRALVCFHFDLVPWKLRRLARLAPPLPRIVAEQASLARALVATAGGRSGHDDVRRRLRPLLASFDRRRACLYRALSLAPEDVWARQAGLDLAQHAAIDGTGHTTGPWQPFA